MMSTQAAAISLNPWLTFLAQWLPPRQVTHVGANVPSIYQSALNGVELLVIDADPTKKDLVQQQLPGRQFQFLPHVIAERTGPTAWHQASNPAESGLLAIEQLQRYWQNIRAVGVQTKQGVALDDVFATQTTQPCWLWVDCFPALAILQSAPNALAQANVVLARVDITQVCAPVECSLAAVRAFMRNQGYVLAGVQPERHPSIGTALFFRDFAQLAQEAQTALITANLSRDVLEKQAIALAQQTHDAIQKIAALETEKAQLSAACDEQSKQAAALAEQAQDANQKIAELLAQNTQLSAACDAAAQAKATALAAKSAESESQQQAFQQELYRAEIQIELIKDLLLREPGL